MRSDYFERPVSFRVEEMASLEVVLSGAERQAESLYRKGSETMEKSKYVKERSHLQYREFAGSAHALHPT